MPSGSGDPKLLDVHLPEGVDEAPLEALEQYRLSDDPDHESMPLQNAVDRPPARSDPSAGEESVDSHGTPSGVLPPQLVHGIDEVPVDAVRAVVRTPRLIPEPLDAFLPIVSTPAA
jgi:hypothetical protein